MMFVEEDDQGGKEAMKNDWDHDFPVDGPFDEAQSQWPSILSHELHLELRMNTGMANLRGLCLDVLANVLAGLRKWCRGLSSTPP